MARSTASYELRRGGPVARRSIRVIRVGALLHRGADPRSPFSLVGIRNPSHAAALQSALAVGPTYEADGHSNYHHGKVRIY